MFSDQYIITNNKVTKIAKASVKHKIHVLKTTTQLASSSLHHALLACRVKQTQGVLFSNLR